MRKLYILAIMTLLSNLLIQAQVEIIGHRGASYLAPENTVASSKLAFSLGADAVETDIYLSKDNKIMCIHDSNARRTTGEDYSIKNTDSEVLRKLDAGSFKDTKFRGERIPFLSELIKIVPKGKELVIEIKCGVEVLPFLKEEIMKAGKNKTFVFIAFDFATITETKKTFPENKCYWLCSNSNLFDKILPEIPPTGVNGVSLSNGIINENVAQSVESMNLELFTWTVDDPAEARRLIGLGVRGITTNRPGWLREQLVK